jgi:chromosome segregation ATPase
MADTNEDRLDWFEQDKRAHEESKALRTNMDTPGKYRAEERQDRLFQEVERLRSALTEIEDAGLHYQKSPYLSSLLVKIEALTKERDELKKWGEEHKEGYIEVREQLADTLKEITELKQKLAEAEGKNESEWETGYDQGLREGKQL